MQRTPHVSTPYDCAFFEGQSDDAYIAAKVVVPLILDICHPSSVLDVGCGRGAWLRAFEECGIDDVSGIDGDYVDRARLLVDSSAFTACDLTLPVQLTRDYDLVTCLEVAEHLPGISSMHLVELLTRAAPLVLFSAAVPGQGGTSHINEQWPDYWKELFLRYDFRRADPIRHKIWRDHRVAWWYRQNIYLFFSEAAAERIPYLLDEAEMDARSELQLVHANHLTRYMPTRELLGECATRVLRRLGIRRRD